MRALLPAALVVLTLATGARAQDDELPSKVLVVLNQANTADDAQQQMALVEIGNVLRSHEIAFEVEADSSCTATSNGCLDLVAGGRAEAVLILSVYHHGDEGSVDLQVFDGQMSGVGNEAWVGDPSAAAGRAMRHALEGFAPEYVRVHLTGTPEGASVLFGGLTGELPFIGRLRPGTHRLRVSADGFRTHTEDLEVPATTETWTHAVALTEGEDPASGQLTGPDGQLSDPDATDDEPGNGRGALLALGAVGLAAGVGLAVTGAVLFARDGQCVEDGCGRTGADRRTYRRWETTAGSVALLVSGGILAASGFVLTFAGARVDASVGPDHAALSLSGSF